MPSATCEGKIHHDTLLVCFARVQEKRRTKKAQRQLSMKKQEAVRWVGDQRITAWFPTKQSYMRYTWVMFWIRCFIGTSEADVRGLCLCCDVTLRRNCAVSPKASQGVLVERRVATLTKREVAMQQELTI